MKKVVVYVVDNEGYEYKTLLLDEGKVYDFEVRIKELNDEWYNDYENKVMEYNGINEFLELKLFRDYEEISLRVVEID